jgi:hypothetical protein
VNDYYVGYVQDWSVPNIDDLLVKFVESDLLNRTKVKAEVELMEKFLTIDNKKFSKVFVRIDGLHNVADSFKMQRVYKRNKMIIHTRSLRSSNDGSDLSNVTANKQETTVQTYTDIEHSLFKVRMAYFKNALPIYKDVVKKIIERAWTLTVNISQFESQNGLRVNLNIQQWSRHSTEKGDPVDGYEYTISINGQDPEFLAMIEPTFDNFITATKEIIKDLAESDPVASLVQFCSKSVFSIDRIYLRLPSQLSATAEKILNDKIQIDIDSILKEAWIKLNSNHSIARIVESDNSGVNALPLERLVGRAFFKSGFIDSSRSKRQVQRLSISYLVDGVDPSPIYFNRPNVNDLMPYLRKQNLEVYDGIPMVNRSFSLIAHNNTMPQARQRLRAAIKNAWLQANPNLKDAENTFHIVLKVEQNNNDRDLQFNGKSGRLIKRSSSSTIPTTSTSSNDVHNIVYQIGTVDTSYDISEMQEPTLRIISKLIRQQIPGVDILIDREIISQNKEIPSVRKAEVNTFLSFFTLSLFILISILIISEQCICYCWINIWSHLFNHSCMSGFYYTLQKVIYIVDVFYNTSFFFKLILIFFICLFRKFNVYNPSRNVSAIGPRFNRNYNFRK